MKARFRDTSCLAAIILGAAASSALAAPAITVSPLSDHPSANVVVNGAGFTPGETIDIYFDTTDELLAVADSGGRFAKHTFKSSSDALPGQHWVTAVGRKAGDAAQKPYTVSTTWAEFGFKSKGGRNNPWENVISTSNVRKLDTAWIAASGPIYYSSPALVNGVAYVGSDNNNLSAFDAGTGAKQWSAATGDSITSFPAVANGTVYIGSFDGSLYAFNASNGAKLWSAATGNFIFSSPVVANGTVYIGSGDGSLYAFDAGTGTKLWSTAVGGPGSLFASPAVANGVVYIGSEDGNLYALDARTGAQLWIAPTSYGIDSAPAVANGLVYIGSDDGNFYAFNAGTGAKLWSAATDYSGIFSSFSSVANGVVYVATYFGNLYAFDAKSGVVLWTAATGEFIQSSLAVANGIVYIGSNNSGLYAFDAASGVKLWRALTGGSFGSSPTVSDGMVYVGATNGLYAFAIDGGNNAIYKHRNTTPPSFATLHPDYRLKPARPPDEAATIKPPRQKTIEGGIP